MRFFTPELLARYRSADDVAADGADEDWEAALEAYRAHLDALRRRMPPEVGRLADLSLHDAELLDDAEHSDEGGPAEDFLPSTLEFKFLTVRRGDEIVVLAYQLRDRVRRSPAADRWTAPGAAPTCWLYDEIDVEPRDPAAYLHRILLSDGAVLEIPFAAASIRRFSLRGEAPVIESRQTA